MALVTTSISKAAAIFLLLATATACGGDDSTHPGDGGAGDSTVGPNDADPGADGGAVDGTADDVVSSDAGADQDASDAAVAIDAATEAGAPLGTSCDQPNGPSYSGPVATAACASGICRDGVCCDTACNGQCMGCAVSGLEGTCSMVVHAPDDSCPSGQACSNAGVCKTKPGGTCSAPTDCAWGTCVAAYVDSDQDGWGVASQPGGQRCMDTNHSAGGYSDRTGDCCDFDNGANPGYAGSGELATNACGTFDWNCDNAISPVPPLCPPTCPSGAGTYQCWPSLPGCGSTGTANVLQCNASCVCNSTGTVSISERCE